jgi:amino acid adenylation domain-containing protein
MKNILEWLERSEKNFSEKTAFSDDQQEVSYQKLLERAKALGSFLGKFGQKNHAVALLIPRSVETLTAMMGVAYSGNFYVVLDTEMPQKRITAILGKISPFAILTVDALKEKAEELLPGKAVVFENAVQEPINEKLLLQIRENMVDADPLYALFTSGSTGMPKGVVVCHRNVISYINWYVSAFSIDDSVVFGSQTPFYFSMSVSDVYSTLCMGGTLHIIQKQTFSFPLQLLQQLNAKKVNTIYWVPSALCLLANWKAFDYEKPRFLKRVLFAGETMPTRQLNYWMGYLPDCTFANLFGPTETTDICTYYVVNREFADGESLPIGHACNNCDVFVLDENNHLVEPGEKGELFVRGSFVAPGYYAEFEKTADAFVQNPLNPYYPEPVYKTGDLVLYNSYGELEYAGRKDFQIKHMGYRIELGEVEAAASAVTEISSCAVCYDMESDRIILFYQGKKISDEDLMKQLKRRLPPYMLPGRLCRLKSFPYNQNGKIDRKKLLKDYQEQTKC